MPEPLYGLTKSQLDRLTAALRKIESQPLGKWASASTFRPPQYNVGKFKLQEELSDDSSDGADAKFWYEETEGDLVKVYPFGVGGTHDEGTVIAAFWWDAKWWYLAAESCPEEDEEEEE